MADRRRHPTPPHSTPGFTLGLVQSLGFLINWEKSALTPTPRVSGGRDRHAEPARPSDSGESRKDFGSGKGPKGPGDGSRQDLDAVLRLPGKPSRGPTRLPSVHETSADTFSPLLRPNVDLLSRVVPVTDFIRPQLERWLRRPFLTQGRQLTLPNP